MTKDKTVTMSRDEYETLQVPRELLATLTLSWQMGLDFHDEMNQLRALLAAPVVERQEPVVIDLDAVDWETIQQAADESNWMPNEYMRNDWVADVCNFLKYGRADTSPPAPVAVSLNESAEFNKWWSTTEVLKKSKLQIAQEAWQARACLDKVEEMNQ